MSWPLQWGPRDIRALRKARGDSQGTFGKQIHASGGTVSRWERGAQPVSAPGLVQALDGLWEQLTPLQRLRFDLLRAQGHHSGAGENPASLAVVAAELKLALAEVRALIRASSVDAVAARQGDDVDRSEFLRRFLPGVFGAGLLPGEALERIADDRAVTVDPELVAVHERIAHEFAVVFPTFRADVLAGPVAGYAEKVGRLLDRPMTPTLRSRLSEVAVGVHAEAGLLAFHSGDRWAARRYFALARDIAEESGDATLCAQMLGAASILWSTIPLGGRGGDSRRAVEMLSAALERAPEGARRTRAWLHWWLGEELAMMGEERAFRVQMDQAQRCSPGQDEVFIGSCVLYIVPGVLACKMGLGLLALGYRDEGLAALDDVTPNSDRWRVAVLAGTAASHAKHNEPQQACADLHHAADLAEHAGHRMGVERIRGVRAQFPDTLTGLDCVRELDERLRLLT